MKMKKPQTENVAIELPPIDLRSMTITLVGDSPLICHAWSEKAKKAMRDKHQKKAKTAKEVRNPEAEFKASLYHMPGGKYGFPAIGLKASAISAARFVDGLKMTVLRGAFHIDTELVQIQGKPEMREDMVTVGMGSADLRYRGEFKKWRIEADIRFNAAVISPEQITHLFNVGGFGVGIGEWRPERNGSSGRFHVATGQELKAKRATRRAA
jgi:hypothetical protein